MIASFVVAHTEALLKSLMKFEFPADAVVSRYFRNRKLGMKERSQIATAVFAVLRNRSVYAHLCETGVGPMERRLALLSLSDIGEIDPARLSDAEKEWLERIAKVDRSTLPESVRSNLPEWLHAKLTEQLGAESVSALTESLTKTAPLDLRVNTMKIKRDEVIKQLEQVPVKADKTQYAPNGLRLGKKIALQNMPLFKEGYVEVQDEGSQLLSALVGAKRGEMVVDFCAGAGGKTLSLGDAMRNTGRLYAFDVSEKRLANLKPRLARSALSNVHPVAIAHENDARVKRLAGKADRVLVDAPCSGTGTLRRNPDLKYRLKPSDIAELAEKQLSILSSASRLVKKGGRLVYATCSLLQEENEQVVAAFLEKSPQFKRISVAEVLSDLGISLDTGEYLKLAPHVHGTDGFFAAVFERE